MNPTAPTQSTPSTTTTPQPGTPKLLSEVMKDKRFWMIAPVLLLAFISTGYFLVAGSEKPQKPLINNINSTIPNAQTDSVPKSKLELQAAEQRLNRGRSSSVNGLQTGVIPLQTEDQLSSGLPSTLDPYLYKKQKMPQVTGVPIADPELAAMDSLYNPTASVRHRPGSRNRSSGRRSMPAGASAAYFDAPLPDEFNDELSRPNNTQKQTEDRQRLLALLTEYKRDKDAKAVAAREGERPRKAESGAVVSTLGEMTNRRLNGFYGLYASDQKGQQEAALTEDLGTIRAVIYQDQQIVDGGRVQLRLLEPVTVRGMKIPANTIIYGVGSFGAERVGIGINSLQYEGRIFPIKLMVHDMDGMPGVFVPNVLAAQEGKQLLGQAVGSANYNLSGTGTSARAAATMAGISAAQAGLSGARGVLQRKITQQKATLKGNYYVLLK